MTKTHFQAKLCKQKLPTPRRALPKHLKENMRWQSASARRVNSPVKRLFTAVHSLRLKPPDSGEVCSFLLLLSCRKMPFCEAGKTSLAASEDKLESNAGCSVQRRSSPARRRLRRTGCVYVTWWLKGDLLTDTFVVLGDFFLLCKIKI